MDVIFFLIGALYPGIGKLYIVFGVLTFLGKDQHRPVPFQDMHEFCEARSMTSVQEQK